MAVAMTAVLVTIAASCLHLAHSCGEPSAEHPPALKTSGDHILGLQQGIVGGSDANAHSYPWMFSIGNCGGAILSAKWIVSAAHCFVHNGELKERFRGAGGFDAYVGGRDRYGDTIKVTKVIAHPDFTGTCQGTANDIALLQLDTPLVYSDKVQPICLPSASDNFQEHGNVVTAGWGRLATNGGHPDALQHVVLATQQQKCIDNYKMWYNKDKEMCASLPGKGSCKGDSGGPVFGLKGGRYVLMGITSCGDRGICASDTHPTVYTHVPAYRQWIEQHTGL